MKNLLRILVPLLFVGALAACSDDPEPTSDDTVDKLELEIGEDKVKVNVEEDSDDDG